MENRGRTMVQFGFYKFDAAWRRLPEEVREKDKAEFACAVEEAAEIQGRVRTRFEELTARGYAATGFEPSKEEGAYVLEPYED